MGGGALMTPILLIFFGINPSTAVSSDLVAAMVMKPVGGGVHIRRRTVRWELVRWLCIGSIPAAFAGVFALHATGESETVENITKTLLGVTLLMAAGAMLFKSWLQGKRTASARRGGRQPAAPGAPIHVRVVPTVLVGLLGGFLVGLTSVGSGSIIIVCLMLLYPDLRGAELVGTDLVQAVPLVASAALAHIIVGDFEIALTAAIILGSVPAVWVGARLSSKAPDGLRSAAWIGDEAVKRDAQHLQPQEERGEMAAGQHDHAPQGGERDERVEIGHPAFGPSQIAVRDGHDG
jgi:uncharacterized membrane protein YfcA